MCRDRIAGIAAIYSGFVYPGLVPAQDARCAAKGKRVRRDLNSRGVLCGFLSTTTGRGRLSRGPDLRPTGQRVRRVSARFAYNEAPPPLFVADGPVEGRAESGRSENSPRSLPHHARRRSHVAACSKETAVGDWPGQGVAGPGRATVLSFSTNAGVSR